jgi:general secretion pathway protein I
MIVATLIMAIAVVGLISAISASTRNATRLIEHDRIVQLARTRMNELLVDRNLPREVVVNGDFDPAVTGGGRAGWRARTTVFERSPVYQAGAMTMDRIQLEVWWMAGDSRRTFALDGFRSRFAVKEDYPALAGAEGQR